MTLIELINTIQGYELLNDQQIADALNAKVLPGAVPLGEMYAAAEMDGLLARLDIASEMLQKGSESWAGVRVGMRLFTGPLGVVDFADAKVYSKVQTTLAGYVAGELITQEVADSLMALANNRLSLAEKHLGKTVTKDEVALAFGRLANI